MKNILIFIAGAGIGSVVTWKLVEKKYKNLADEEIASVVERFKEKEKELDKKVKKETKTTKKKKDDKKVEQIIEKEGYIDVNPGEEIRTPYIIAPEQFGDYPEYGTKTLIYYADGILADDIDGPITEDIDVMLGPDALSHFGEYEDDSVYVRDPMNEIDYEILMSTQRYSEISAGSAV